MGSKWLFLHRFDLTLDPANLTEAGWLGSGVTSGHLGETGVKINK